ncbi:MFS transporter [Brevibacterium aurantiacum]|uniref:MFS transporter n=1 Tax=Brevibacterium aurantiacum TaxID=273384 RepID=A0A4Z0KHU4_BREAU|nr:MFS transporter [Brevibacterium aurantiacum]TGD38301.1 MFS transporter [Brevibacterium aurantiacum]
MTSYRYRWWALGFLTTAVFSVSLPATLLNVALPTLAGELGASSGELSWFVSSYLLALTATLLPAGVAADRWGRKKILLAAIAAFGAGSALAASATSPSVFIAAQILSGSAAAAVITTVLAALATLFDADERPRAVGVWAAGAFLALPVGPILGGLILTSAWWGWAFLATLPVLAAAVVGIAITVPESRSEDPATTRARGLLRGLHSLLSARFLSASAMAALGLFVLFGVLYGMPQYAQAVFGLDPAGSGLRLLTLLAGVVVAGGLSGRLTGRFGVRAVIAASFVVLALAMGVGAATIGPDGSPLTLAWMFAAGLGAGVVMAAASTAALEAVETSRAGLGSASFQVVQRVGGGLSALFSAGVLTAGYTAALGPLPGPVSEAARRNVFDGLRAADDLRSDAAAQAIRQALTEGLGHMLWLCCGVAALGAITAVLLLPRRSVAAAPAQREHTTTKGQP